MDKNCSSIHAEISHALEPVFSSSSQVLSAALFGSSATGDHTGKSDVDLAVNLREPRNFSLLDRFAIHGDCCRASFSRIAGFPNFLAHDYKVVRAEAICGEILDNLAQVKHFLAHIERIS